MNKKQQIMHIHGGGAFNSYEQYLKTLASFDFRTEPRFSWVKRYADFLDTNNYEFIMPAMPCKENAKYLEWKIYFEKSFSLLRNDIILVGHSLGGIFLAKYLSENRLPVSIAQLHLVSAPMNDENEHEQLADFKIDIFPKNFFENEVGQVHIYHSKDDTVVSISESEKYHAAIPDSIFHIFEDRFHFLDDTFPELFEGIKNADR